MNSLDFLEYKELSTEALKVMKVKNSCVKVKLNVKQALIFKHFSSRLLEAELFYTKSKSFIFKVIQSIYSAYYVFKTLIFYPKIIELQTFLTINPPVMVKSKTMNNAVVFEFTY
ncbi:hypothetical protein AN214_04375 [Pseudoalteromonas sp. P1-9]|uniref:hypothetical protein n=1 Tax=Pseudoalteromonas sp. P1-9 TaxID=1710354 RepID=UPI0006D62DB6|nr:hypothetical protein [Pseudoalteromonas sp. P1-9]KPV93590.1 hypothetical protein AN214_04375 [Pseudoalteromonas sp. P1-9]